jgi:hypothetical protein
MNVEPASRRTTPSNTAPGGQPSSTLAPVWATAPGGADSAGQGRVWRIFGPALRAADAVADEQIAAMLLRPFHIEDLDHESVDSFGKSWQRGFSRLTAVRGVARVARLGA